MLQTLLEPWVWITLAAAFAQNLRSLLQRRLTRELSVQGAAYVRFVYAIPLAYVLFWLVKPNIPQGDALWVFLGYASIGAVAQIVGTFCLVLAVSRGNFAVGTALSKSEAAQAAIFGLLVLGDSISLALGLGITLSFVGVCLLLTWPASDDADNPGKSGLGAATLGVSFWAGLASGTGFAIAAVSFRGAATSLPSGSVLERALLTVVAALTVQTLLHGAYIRLREPGQLRKVLDAWPIGLCVGCIGGLASLGWSAAMTIETAGKVRALGQVEMLFTLFTSTLLLGESLSRRELVGLGFIVVGLLLLLR